MLVLIILSRPDARCTAGSAAKSRRNPALEEVLLKEGKKIIEQRIPDVPALITDVSALFPY